ncbi:Protein of unknown function [Bacillus cytotoxicus]|uniref:Uncharacterized protein n=1 Tax=Bacillus cytotoxicus TaxID=580165 RepID=A0AAX2CGZ8_9BACI|nr:Protein of unknown function [Bacillus cytotoxicus]
MYIVDCMQGAALEGIDIVLSHMEG